MRLHGINSAEWREHYIRWCFLPISTKLLCNPQWNSVTLAIAQYYADNAVDEVHVVYLPSKDMNPSWPFTELGQDERSYLSQAHQEYIKAFHELYGEKSQDQPIFLRYADLITAFASHCRYHAMEDDDFVASYTPYAFFSRDDGLNIVGRMFRPEWEDREWKSSRYEYTESKMATRIDRVLAGKELTLDILMEAVEALEKRNEYKALGWRLWSLFQQDYKDDGVMEQVYDVLSKERGL